MYELRTDGQSTSSFGLFTLLKALIPKSLDSRPLRLRELIDAPFVWARKSPFYDRLIHECYRGGLKSPRIVQEAVNEATILSLVPHRMGVGWVNGTARWRCPERVVIVSVSDLNMPLPLSLVRRKDNTSPLLAGFIADVQRLPDVQTLRRK